VIRTRLRARDLIELVLGDSFVSWDAPVDLTGLDPEYAAQLVAARERSGTDEAVVTGAGTIDGTGVAVIAGEFAFLGGSIGRATARRIVDAVRRATRERLPLLVATCSGGTRMQEGTPAFVEMIAISKAIVAHKAAGLPYLVYLRNPTTGGVFASWGSLGHVTAAEPGALIGFMGPRVFESLHGYPFPEGVQVAENLHRKGLIDAVVPAQEAREVAIRALSVLADDRSRVEAGTPPEEDLRPVEAWEAITRSRRDDRPGVRTLLKLAATDVTPLSGSGEGENEPGLLLALARFGTAPAVVLGQDRRVQRTNSPLGPAGLRVARRGMRLAAELGLPLITVVDTAGADLSKAAEEGGLAAEIARCLAELVMLDAPTVCLLLGEGAGGAALALLPADRVLCAQHAWLSPLPPEGASAILYRSVDFAPEIAQAQRIRATDLRRDGIVDRVVPEVPDAAYEPRQFCERVGRALEYEIANLLELSPADRFAARRARFRNLG
jgi:acetyl-CoA carboxylase carboxyl transferase subunit beta